MKISQADHAKIAAAIGAAEATTAGEIACVLAPKVGDYRAAPWLWATAAAFILPLVGLYAGFHPRALAEPVSRAFSGGWTDHNAADPGITLLELFAFLGEQMVIFALAAVVVSLPPIRRALTPAAQKAEAVHRAALTQFQALGMSQTRERTGVLIFAALAERRAEVIADEGIYAKAPGQVWDEVIDILVAGMKRGQPGDAFAGAVKRVGEILAEHVPPTGDNANELPDRLVELK
jgi:putative membrane protein